MQQRREQAAAAVTLQQHHTLAAPHSKPRPHHGCQWLTDAPPKALRLRSRPQRQKKEQPGIDQSGERGKRRRATRG